MIHMREFNDFETKNIRFLVNKQVEYATIQITETGLKKSILDATAPVYYVNKNFVVRRISKFAGKFDPDGKYFYYTNNDDTLQRINLNDEDAVSEKIAEDIVDFEITQKGNIYCLRDTSTLIYYNTAKEKNTRIADNVDNISMYSYTNTLYYTIADTSSVYTSEEGSTKKEAAKFDSSNVTGLPVFVDANCKKTFVTFYDEDSDECRMFYTSNGKKFSLVAVCGIDIQGFNSANLVKAFLTDMFDDIIPDVDDSNETTEPEEETTNKNTN